VITHKDGNQTPREVLQRYNLETRATLEECDGPDRDSTGLSSNRHMNSVAFIWMVLAYSNCGDEGISFPRGVPQSVASASRAAGPFLCARWASFVLRS